MLTITKFHGDELKCIKTNNDVKITKDKFYTVTFLLYQFIKRKYPEKEE